MPGTLTLTGSRANSNGCTAPPLNGGTREKYRPQRWRCFGRNCLEKTTNGCPQFVPKFDKFGGDISVLGMLAGTEPINHFFAS
jgi:hypothetical protein